MVTEKRREKLMQVAKSRQKGVTVVLEDIHDPHNAAAILRTCDGLGIQDVRFIFSKEKKYNPKTVGKSSSSSANKWLDFILYSSTEVCLNELHKSGYTTFATALTDRAQSLYQTSFMDTNVAIILGNEHSGLSDIALKMSNKIVMLPLVGMVQSLNVSVTAAIFLYECVRQRRELGDWSLFTNEMTDSLFKSFEERSGK